MRVIPIAGANAGPMTGRGTNAYLLPGARPTLIDAPEASDQFVDRVAGALETEQPGAALAQVLVTHFHHDHVDGVAALAARWPGLTVAKFPLPEQDARHAVSWTPLKDGELVPAGDGTLWAVHTPGHAPDHLTFLEMRSSILFCGDLSRRAFSGVALFPRAAPTGGILLMLGWLLVGISALLRLRA